MGERNLDGGENVVEEIPEGEEGLKGVVPYSKDIILVPEPHGGEES